MYAGIFGHEVTWSRCQPPGPDTTAQMVGVNKGCFDASGTPWAGAKPSGYDYHGSAERLPQFVPVKVLRETT